MTIETVVNRALRLIGVIDPDETPATGESSDAIETLNTMLAAWSVFSQGVYRQTSESFDLVAGTGSYLIGSGEAFDTVRPNQVLSAFIRQTNQDYPLEIVSGLDYDEMVTDKTVQGLPEYLFYDPTYADGKIYLSPVPDNSAYDLHIRSVKPLSSYTNTTDTLDLPPEYEAAIPWNLAVELAPEYGVTPMNIVVMKAQETLASLKSLHCHPIPQTDTDVVNTGPKRFEINRGY